MIKGSATISDNDRGYAETLDRLLGGKGGGLLTVGIHDEEGFDDHDDLSGLSIAEVATFHEFGLGVPRRSFIADWFDETKEEKQAQFRAMAKAIVKGTVPSVEIGLQRLGALYVGQVQKRIADGIEPPLAESTIKHKGSSVPLIGTGVMRSAITFKIEET